MRILLFAAILAVPVVAGAQVDTDLPANEPEEGFFDGGMGFGLVIGGGGLLVLLGGLYFLGIGGLRHVDADNVLDHPLRAQILEAVKETPGIHLRELSQIHETAVTNTQWHLRKLEMAGLVRTQKVGGRRLYYPTQGGIQMRDAALQNAATRNPNAASIFQYINGHAGCNQRALAEELSMNPGTVRWHLRRLQDAGLVRALDEGASTVYYSATMRPPRPRRN